MDFRCNVCGAHNADIERAVVSSREAPSCLTCHSSLRMRSVIHALSMELYGKALVLPDFPEDKSVVGLGMSDWDGYALPLAQKFSYTNTYYHTEPRLDITAPDARWLGQNHFMITSDVFEHIPIRGLRQGFHGCRQLMAEDGVVIFTAPYHKHGHNQEHFPSLHEFRIEEVQGKKVLFNTTEDGREERFEDLIFHGGEGATLEMRWFSEPDLRAAFEDAGFASMRVYSENVPEFGILWPMDYALPVAVRTRPGAGPVLRSAAP